MTYAITAVRHARSSLPSPACRSSCVALAEFADEAHRWLESLSKPREIDQSELNSVVASVAHLAYHVGAIRQIDLSARGPSAED